MKNQTKVIKSIALLLAGTMLLASCTSTTLIQSNPIGAKLYINNELVGNTPYTYQDTKIVGSRTFVKMEKEGYETLETSFARDEEIEVGAIIGGIFLLVPFLWTMKYKSMHSYTMLPNNGNTGEKPQDKPQTQPTQSKSKADKLRELKQLLDDKIITQEEYEKEKKKILDADDK
jgi:PEGA domain/Short C-terminal domain